MVTGGSRGIGAATARLGAVRGYAVCIAYLRHEAAASAGGSKRLRRAEAGPSRSRPTSACEADVVRLFRRGQMPTWGRSARWSITAGILETQARVENMDAGRLSRVFAANVFGSFLCAREAVRRMSARHGGAGGAIVNVSSAAAAPRGAERIRGLRRRQGRHRHLHHRSGEGSRCRRHSG
ncbi:MAG: SDR family NAD(P)-dependent oxidoreductase [Comamonadaceae bacterium]|nr:SDR family NAD(P)-dependent oxidoreductase [Comamonadaceae bacterium]